MQFDSCKLLKVPRQWNSLIGKEKATGFEWLFGALSPQYLLSI